MSNGIERVERRLAAILVADVVGSSRLVEADEAYALSAIQAVLQEVLVAAAVEHGGRLIKTMGDGALIEFASPVSAVTCAVAVQKVLAERAIGVADDRRVLLRIGVNVGDVVARPDGDLYGDGVNVAARLEPLADPGGIACSGKVHEELHGKLTLDWYDKGELSLKNIARPVRVYVLGGESNASTHPPSAGQALPIPDKPSIAVLPFTNMSGDPEQEYFADGMTEDIITALSQIESFFVIARNTTFTFKGRAVDVRAVGRELGVQYVLEGSVRKTGNKVRVTAQLIEASSANHIWANRYDRDLTDLFAVQDELTASIVGSLHPELFAAEAKLSKRHRPTSLDAWGLTVRALAHLATLSQADLELALSLADSAIEKTPDYALAHGVRSFALGYRAYVQWSHDWYEDARRASADINLALQLGGNDATVLFLVGAASKFMARHRTAIGLLERALELQPNLASARGLLALGYASVGRPAEGLSTVEKAFRLSPRDPMAYMFFASQSLCYFVLKDFVRAVDAANSGLRLNSRSLENHLYKAAALAELGDLEGAANEIARAQRLAPNVRLTVIARACREGSGWRAYHAALKKAGLPD